MTGGPESPRNPPESVPETGELGPDSPWRRAAVPAEALVFPDTTPRKIRLRRLFGRLRGSNSGYGPKIDDPAPKNVAPVNLRRWTWEVLPHVSETRDGSRLARLMDRIAWHMTLPDARYVLHADRIRRRRESLLERALVRFAATLAGRPSRSPPWLIGDRRDGNE